jgi:hypothetical protein
MPVRYLYCISYIKLTCHSVTALHTLNISHLSILVAFIDLQWLRRLTADHSPRRSDFDLELSHVRLDLYKVALGEVFVDVCFSLLVSFHLMSRDYSHNAFNN